VKNVLKKYKNDYLCSRHVNLFMKKKFVFYYINIITLLKFIRVDILCIILNYTRNLFFNVITFFTLYERTKNELFEKTFLYIYNNNNWLFKSYYNSIFKYVNTHFGICLTLEYSGFI